MALTDEIFQKHLNSTKKTFKRQYNHFRPFDDPDHSEKLHDSSLFTKNRNDRLLDLKSNYNDKQLEISTLKISHSIDNTKSNQTQIQTGHKLDTNWTQTRHKQDTNWTQMGHK